MRLPKSARHFHLKETFHTTTKNPFPLFLPPRPLVIQSFGSKKKKKKKKEKKEKEEKRGGGGGGGVNS
jgi:hypothetical protein